MLSGSYLKHHYQGLSATEFKSKKLEKESDEE
jgi:hypothetical protein